MQAAPVRKPKRPCPVPGCGVATRERYCPAHTRHDALQHDRTRPSASRRGYNRTWQKWRAQFLRRHPECEISGSRCLGLADQVDHIIPLARGGENKPSNWQAACQPCHSHKTATEDGGYVGRHHRAADGHGSPPQLHLVKG